MSIDLKPIRLALEHAYQEHLEGNMYATVRCELEEALAILNAPDEPSTDRERIEELEKILKMIKELTRNPPTYYLTQVGALCDNLISSKEDGQPVEERGLDMAGLMAAIRYWQSINYPDNPTLQQAIKEYLRASSPVRESGNRIRECEDALARFHYLATHTFEERHAANKGGHFTAYNRYSAKYGNPTEIEDGK